MQPPVMTKQLASRLHQALVSLTVAGLSSAQQQPGNPFGIEIRRFGSATAILADRAPAEGWWNRVVGLLPADADLIDDIVAFYREHGRRCHVDLDPLTLTEVIARRLAAHGFYPIPSHPLSRKRDSLRLTRQPMTHDTVIRDTEAAVDTIGRMTLALYETTAHSDRTAQERIAGRGSCLPPCRNEYGDT